MIELKIFISLIGVMFAAVIGLYVWTYNVSCKTQEKLGAIYEKMHGHIENTGVHCDPINPFQRKDVCDIKHTQIMDTLGELKEDTKALLKLHIVDDGK